MSKDKETDGPKKVFSILEGGKVAADIPGTGDDESIAQSPYVVVDIEGNEHFADGFLLFTSHHIAIMQDTSKGPTPVLVFPLNQVKYAEMLVDDQGNATAELPF